MGARTMAIRGDFMLYLLSGIFLYLVHIQALTSVMNSENSTSPMMQHAPMNTLVAILSSALSILYVKTISILVILFVLHTLFQPIEMDDWSGAMLMYLLAWGSGCAIGLILMAFKPWAPDVVSIIQLVYVRANMIASGKMFVANTLPGFMLAMFDWNPLFPHHRPDAGLRLRQLFPALFELAVSALCNLRADHDRHDGRVFHAASALRPAGTRAAEPAVSPPREASG